MRTAKISHPQPHLLGQLAARALFGYHRLESFPVSCIDLFLVDAPSGRNVMLKFSPNDKRMFTAKICDFGLAHMCYGEISANMFGTISHMPPELLMDGRLTFASGTSMSLIAPPPAASTDVAAAAPTMPDGKAIDGDAADLVEAVFAYAQMTASMMWRTLPMDMPSLIPVCLAAATMFSIHRCLGVRCPHVGDVHRKAGIPG